jgi:type IV pilus assembly protein PilB
MAQQLFVEPIPDANDEQKRAHELALRYRCEYIELKGYKVQHELFRKVPVELMFRFNFIPLEELPDGRLAIALADPSQLQVIDEISLLLNRRVIPRVATLTEITEILKKTEQSQRVLDEAGETFTLDVIHDDDANGDETISIEKLTQESDISPIIRLVDTTIFTALQRRASDIHMETRDDCVVIKYRIDVVLQEAM